MMQQYKLSDNDIEDWYGTFAIAMCKAAMAYDPSKNIKFITFAAMCMQNEIYKAYRKENKSVKGLISLDQEINNDTKKIKFSDLISDTHSSEYIYTIELLEIIRNIFKKFNNRDKEIIELCCQGEKQSDVAKEFHIGKSNVSKIFTKFRNELSKELKNEY